MHLPHVLRHACADHSITSILDTARASAMYRAIGAVPLILRGQLASSIATCLPRRPAADVAGRLSSACITPFLRLGRSSAPTRPMPASGLLIALDAFSLNLIESHCLLTATSLAPRCLALLLHCHRCARCQLPGPDISCDS